MDDSQTFTIDKSGDNVYEIYLTAESVVRDKDFSGEVLGVDLETLQKVLDSALTVAVNSAEPDETDDDEELFRDVVNDLQLIAFTAGMLYAQELSGAIPDAQVVLTADEATDLVKALLAKGSANFRFVVEGDV